MTGFPPIGRSRMLAPRAVLLLLLCAAVGAADARPAPATILQKTGTEQQVWVHSHGYDQVHFSLEEKGPVSTIPSAQILDVRYDRSRDVSYQRAMRYLDGSNWESAATYFAEAAEKGIYEWVRVDSLLRQGDALQKAKRYDDAIAAYDRLMGTYPKSVQVPVALYRKGQAQLASHQEAEALKTYETLRKQAKQYGEHHGAYATALAALGKAAALAAKDQFAQAADELKPALAKLDPRSFSESFGQVGNALAAYLVQAERTDEALQVYDAIVYQPILPEAQGQAHLGRARLLEQTKRKVAAFDAAIHAMLRGSNLPSVAGPAREMAKRLAAELAKDPAVSPEDQKQYRLYGSNI